MYMYINIYIWTPSILTLPPKEWKMWDRLEDCSSSPVVHWGLISNCGIEDKNVDRSEIHILEVKLMGHGDELRGMTKQCQEKCQSLLLNL